MNGSWTHDELQRCLTQKQQWVKSKTNQNPNEAATKNACIEPILRALGWDPSDDEEVVPEWGKSQAAGRADYALITEHGGHPIAVLEAKSLTTTISDKDVIQTLNYAHSQQVTWAIVTNGLSWRLYDALKPAQWNERLVWSLQIDDFDAAEKLSQIAKSELPSLKSKLERVQDAALLKDVLERLFRHPTAELVALLGKESGLPETRVLELLTRQEAQMPSSSVSESSTQMWSRPRQTEIHQEAPISSTRISDYVWVGDAELAFQNTKPVAFRFGDMVIEADTWRSVWIMTARQIFEVDRAALIRAAKADEFAGRQRRKIDFTHEGMRSVSRIGPVFIEINLSANDCVKFARKLLEFALPGTTFDVSLQQLIP